MNKKINYVLAIIVIILITVIAIIIWLGQKGSSQSVQTMPLSKTTDEVKKYDDITNKQISEQKSNLSNETKDISQMMEKRFSGSGCYTKEENGSDNLYELSKDFNLSDSTTKNLYVNQAKGISFEIPYNPNWGNMNCKVEPYSGFTQPNGDIFLEFGKPRAWTRSEFILTISGHRTAEDIINEQKNFIGESNPNPRKITLGNKQVVAYESYGIGTEWIYEIIGTKYNYKFSHSDFELNKTIIKELEKIIEGVKIK